MPSCQHPIYSSLTYSATGDAAVVSELACFSELAPIVFLPEELTNVIILQLSSNASSVTHATPQSQLVTVSQTCVLAFIWWGKLNISKPA